MTAVTLGREELLALAHKIERLRAAYLDALGRGPGGEVERLALIQLLRDEETTIIAGLRLAAMPALRLAAKPSEGVPREEFEIVRKASRQFEEAANLWMERALKAEALKP